MEGLHRLLGMPRRGLMRRVVRGAEERTSDCRSTWSTWSTWLLSQSRVQHPPRTPRAAGCMSEREARSCKRVRPAVHRSTALGALSQRLHTRDWFAFSILCAGALHARLMHT